jgi:hypothetical protein
MARNTIGSRRGSVRGAPPQVYVPFGLYNPDEHQLRQTIRFFGDWLKIAAFFVLVIFVLAILATFAEPE